MNVRETDRFAPESVRLIGELWQELDVLYPEVDGAPFRPDGISGKRTAFVIAWLDDVAVGCGAFQPLENDENSTAEIKRMYVPPSMRRHGVARQILIKLEQLAADQSYVRVRLETGIRQPAAIRLYETAGYYRINPYGRYREDPMSVCFEKILNPTSA